MQFIDQSYRDLQAYWQQIPPNTGEQMLLSFAASCCVDVICGGDLTTGLIIGSVSALATAIHAWVTPVFKEMVNPRQQLSWGEEMLRTSASIIVTSSLMASIGYSALLQHFFEVCVVYGLLTYFHKSRRDVNRTAWIIL